VRAALEVVLVLLLTVALSFPVFFCCSPFQTYIVAVLLEKVLMKLTLRAVQAGAIAAPLIHVGGFGVGRFGVGGSNTTIGTRNFSCAAHWDFSDRLSGYKKAGRDEFLALLKEQLAVAEENLATYQSRSLQDTTGGGRGEGCSSKEESERSPEENAKDGRSALERSALEFLTPATAVQFLRDHFEVQSSMKSVPSVCAWYVLRRLLVLDKFPFFCWNKGMWIRRCYYLISFLFLRGRT
jgi:hypothetical protein